MSELQAYLSLSFICIISVMLIRVFFKSSAAKFLLPPTPFALPIIGHLHLLVPIPHQAFHKLSLKHGPIFRLSLGSLPCVVASSPEIAKELLKTNENAYLDRPTDSSSGFQFSYGLKDFIFAPYGPYWIFMKKLVVSQLLNKTALDMHSSVRHDEINRFIKSLYDNAKVGKAVNLSGELMKMTNNVITRMVMSKISSTNEGDEASKLVAEITMAVGRFNLSDHIWLFKTLDLQGFEKKVKDIRSRFDAMTERVIKEHEEARKHKKIGEVKSLLDILLDISEDKSMEMDLTRENIKAFILDMYIAGTDTSSTTIEWGLSELINHPNIMTKAKEEIDQLVGKNRLIEESDIPNLPYLEAIVKETLRLHPSATVIPRKSRQDCVVAGYHVPSNTNILINVWALGRDPNHWENPLEFRPERFIENPLEMRGQHFHMLPFGSGKRMCPGISLAMLVVHTTLGRMIQCFNWKAGKDGNLTRVDMEEGLGITTPRANPLVCVPMAQIDPIPSSI